MPHRNMLWATAATALLLTALGAAGCVDDDRSFYIRQNQVPDDSCQVSASASEVFRGHGILDVSVAGYGYYLHPLIESHMNTTTGDNQPERNVLHMRRFDIEVDTGGLLSIGKFSFPVSGTLEPGGTLAYAGIEVLSKADAAVLGAGVGPNDEPVVTVKVRAIADRSGETVESAEFVYPITLCNGCLVTMLPSCSDTYTASSNACGLPQDEPVVCCSEGCFAGDGSGS